MIGLQPPAPLVQPYHRTHAEPRAEYAETLHGLRGILLTAQRLGDQVELVPEQAGNRVPYPVGHAPQYLLGEVLKELDRNRLGRRLSLAAAGLFGLAVLLFLALFRAGDFTALLAFTKQHREMSLAVAMVGEHTVGVPHLLQKLGGVLLIPLRPFGSAPVQKPLFAGLGHGRLGRGNHLKLGMAGQKVQHRPLVLGRGKGAGGVDQVPARAEHFRRFFQDLTLSHGAQSHVLGAPHGHGIRLLAEHTLTRAGSVHHDLIEEDREFLGQLGGGGVGDHGVPYPHALHVLGQDSRAGGVDLVGHQKPLTAQGGGQLGSLAAGGGAEVKYPLTGLGGTQGGGEHGAGLLDVVRPRLVEGVLAGAGLPVGGVVKAVSLPRDRLPHKGRDLPQSLGSQLQGIHPQGGVDVLGVGIAEGGEVIPQHPPHPLGKTTGESQALAVALDVFVVHVMFSFLLNVVKKLQFIGRLKSLW